jgi:CrcB protein
MPALLLVMLGGALGAGARHLVGRVMLGWLGPGFPWWTLSVNVAGGLLMGLLAGVLTRFALADGWRLFLGVGVLGGFTTFSSFSLEAVTLAQRGDLVPAALYVAASVAGAIGALVLGLLAARSLA